MEKAQDRLTETIIGCAIKVHRALGPGLLGSAYEACLTHELVGQGLAVKGQVPVPVVYEEVKLECGYRIDTLVEDSVVIEVKSVDELAPVHMAQLLTYLKLAKKRVGLLINFNVETLKDGIRRVVRG
jgi:GxxExxY protein